MYVVDQPPPQLTNTKLSINVMYNLVVLAKR